MVTDTKLFGTLSIDNIVVTQQMFTRDDMKKAFFAGWNESCEGFNNECPEDEPLCHDYLLGKFDEKFPELDNA